MSSTSNRLCATVPSSIIPSLFGLQEGGARKQLSQWVQRGNEHNNVTVCLKLKIIIQLIRIGLCKAQETGFGRMVSIPSRPHEPGSSPTQRVFGSGHFLSVAELFSTIYMGSVGPVYFWAGMLGVLGFRPKIPGGVPSHVTFRFCKKRAAE